ncbi:MULTISPECIES: helix-turn-helix domain-containing protein [Alphaproteobacteria]|uniref:helix-turn-helix domain-containing protein n=1 Tax=Alphaproteobacteria TaxID=28211 RepID=UPI003A90F21C
MMKHPLTLYRERHGLTLEAFAMRVGATKGTVSKWERRIAEPRPRYRAAIIDATAAELTHADLLIAEGEIIS